MSTGQAAGTIDTFRLRSGKYVSNVFVTGDRRRPPPGLSLSPSKFGLSENTLEETALDRVNVSLEWLLVGVVAINGAVVMVEN